MKMKICMLGTGSLGSTIGGTLAQGGSEVYNTRSSVSTGSERTVCA